MNDKQKQMIQELTQHLQDTHAHNAEKYLNNAVGTEAVADVLAAAMAQCVNETLAHVIAKLNDIADAE